MQSPVDHYFETLEEPQRSCLLFLRNFILAFSEHIHEERKFNTPFYYFRKRWIAFISYDPKTKEIYISFVDGYRLDHPKLLSEGRKKMKIFRVDPTRNIDVKALKSILEAVVSLPLKTGK